MPASLTPRLVKACRREILDRPPVWLMRQAGRYMPEYQAVRSQVSFLDLCKTVELAAEVSLQPYRAFGTDGVIMFSDILTIPEAMGMALDFTEKGPVFANPLRNPADVVSLPIPDPEQAIAFVPKILHTLRQALSSHPETALIGFSGAPWTLAAYMIEGGTSRNFTHLKTWMFEHPKALHQLLDKLAQSVTLYLNMQIDAGAQVVQLFDTWAGILSREEYRRFVLPYHQQIIDNLNRNAAPVILYVNKSRGLIDLMAEANPNVLSIDTETSLSEARAQVGNRFALQGNLDPNALFVNPKVLTAMTEQMLAEGGNQGYIANLGHGVLPQTPVDHVRLFVNTVQQRQPLLT